MFFAKSHQAYRRSRRLPVRFTVCDQCFPRPASFGTSLLAQVQFGPHLIAAWSSATSTRIVTRTSHRRETTVRGTSACGAAPGPKLRPGCPADRRTTRPAVRIGTERRGLLVALSYDIAYPLDDEVIVQDLVGFADTFTGLDDPGLMARAWE